MPFLKKICFCKIMSISVSLLLKIDKKDFLKRYELLRIMCNQGLMKVLAPYSL
ncbi:mCG148459 [Mus musculus]|nr:mCG148459 [Mus musculus]